MREFTHLDLFSGIGGFALAARWAGFKTVAFCEIDPFCRKVLNKHWPLVPIAHDIKTFSYHGEVDILTGGFPCQPFSIAGKKKGKDDDRYLWPEMFRIIRKCKPTWIIAENVAGIVGMELDNIVNDLESEDYRVQSYLIPACAAGAPHKRERLWIIANRDGERFNEWSNNRQERYFQDDWKRNVEALQSEWTQFKPKSWETFNAQEWLDAANTASIRSSTKRESKQPMHSETNRERTTTNAINDLDEFQWEEDQPPVSGMDDGLPQGLDRCKSLGNAIVPQVAFPMFALIKSILLRY